jgi:hypothetical protein
MSLSVRSWLPIVLGLLVLGSERMDAQSRGSARTSVNRNTNVNRNANVNRNVNVNQNVNVNRNVNVNVDRDVYVHGGYYSTGCCYHPVATAAAVTATVLAIGTIVSSIPPSCSAVIVGGVTYQQCGSTWYQPRFVGTTTSYVVVAAPR